MRFYLTTAEQYRNAPVGTVVADANYHPHWVKITPAGWDYIDSAAGPEYEGYRLGQAVAIPRCVIRWGQAA